MQQKNKAKSILLLAILIVAVLLIVNIGLIIRINQLNSENNNIQKTIDKQNEIISQYEGSSTHTIDESATTNK